MNDEMNALIARIDLVESVIQTALESLPGVRPVQEGTENYVGSTGSHR